MTPGNHPKIVRITHTRSSIVQPVKSNVDNGGKMIAKITERWKLTENIAIEWFFEMNNSIYIDEKQQT